MTGWAATKRLLRELRVEFTNMRLLILLGTIISALLTSFATAVVFEERFFDGAWSYFLLLPVFYAVFSYYRHHLGPPPSVEDRLGRIVASQGFTPQTQVEQPVEQVFFKQLDEVFFRKILITLDGVTLSKQLLPLVRFLSLAEGTQVELLLVSNDLSRTKAQQLDYVRGLSEMFIKAGLSTNFKITQGDASSLIDRRAVTTQADIILMTTVGNSPVTKLISNNVVETVIKKTLIPTLIIQDDDLDAPFVRFKRILVALDGSEAAEAVLPYIRSLVRGAGSQVMLLSVPEGSESEQYSHVIQRYLEGIAEQLKKDGIQSTLHVTGSGPSRTILAMAEEEKADLIVMASHGRGGIDRPTIHMGSVTEKVLQDTKCPIFIVPLTTGS